MSRREKPGVKTRERITFTTPLAQQRVFTPKPGGVMPERVTPTSTKWFNPVPGNLSVPDFLPEHFIPPVKFSPKNSSGNLTFKDPGQGKMAPTSHYRNLVIPPLSGNSGSP